MSVEKINSLYEPFVQRFTAVYRSYQMDLEELVEQGNRLSEEMLASMAEATDSHDRIFLSRSYAGHVQTMMVVEHELLHVKQRIEFSEQFLADIFHDHE